MRKIWLLFLVMAVSLAGYTQMPGMGGGRRGPGGGQIPSIGHFYGKVVDAKTGKGMDGASIQLIQTKFDTSTHSRKDTIISGAITRRSGEFSFENLPILGSFRLKITAIGYTTYENKVAFDLKGLRGGGGAPGGGAAGADDAEAQQQQLSKAMQALNAVDKDLGNIKLTEDAQLLASATVTASKPLLTMGVDRKVYNVEKDLTASGGSGVDVMRNVPSLQVDIDGNVTLRNSTPTIFVDGRPTTLTLDQIPGDAIQSVEIITNPGAKYDASGGTAGILNIVLKKNRKAGYNGNIRAGMDQRGKANFGGDINVKQSKVNFFLSGNFNQRKSISPGVTNRYTFNQPGNPPPPNDSLIQYDNNVNKGYFAFGRGGMDFLLDNRNTLSVTGNIVHGTFTPYTNSNIYVDTLFPTGTTYSYTRRVSTSNSLFNNHGAMLSFKHTFPKSGEEWSADVNYNQGTNNNNNLIASDIHSVKGGPLTSIYNQQQAVNGTNKFFTAQTDYTLPLGEKSKLEAGARIAIRNIYSLTDLDTLGKGGEYVVESLLSSQFKYRDQVTAGYVTYSNVLGGFSYQLGLRAEGYKYTGEEHYTAVAQDGTQTPAIGNYGHNLPLNVFPSAFLTQKLTDNQTLSLSYTRRIDRPSFNQLFPFTDYSDSLNLSRGNPNLKPQFTNSLELAYTLNYAATNTFMASVYYKNTTDLITRNADTSINPVTQKTVIINSYINAKSGFVGGLELIGRNTLTKWWDLTSNLNLYTSKINTVDTGILAVAPIGQIYSVFAKVINSFKLSNHFSVQLSGDYTSKTQLPPGGSASTGGGGGMGGRGGSVSGNSQGYNRPTGGVDASIRYEFLKNKAASLTLSGSDLFRTRVNDVYTTSGSFTQEAVRRRDPQYFRLQFNWRFGKFDMALFKRKNTKGEQEGIQGAMPPGGGPSGGGEQRQN
jgi:outer membrane receptor protein involved in Fe transport